MLSVLLLLYTILLYYTILLLYYIYLLKKNPGVGWVCKGQEGGGGFEIMSNSDAVYQYKARCLL